MNKKSLLLFSLLHFTILFSLQSQNTDRPNVILILADDLGYSDIGCYGGEIKTPALDQMANGGMRLTSMYNAGMCVISRSSMLTGKWWPKVGYGIKNDTNIAQKLKASGYRTGLIGKWHLNGAPNDKGFDYFFGFLGGYSSYYKGGKDYRINKKPFNNFGDDFYSTDAFTDYAIDFINPQKTKNNKPFFLYLSYQSPHNPLQAPKEQIMAHRGNYLKGWQAIRNARIKNQIKFGIINKETPLPDYPKNLPNWDTLTPEQKDLEDLRMSVYAAMVERMDNGIDKLLHALDANGQIENTLILFMSDNGTDSFSVMDDVMLKKGLLPGDVGSNYQPGTGWAYASVTPNRLYKISQHNGGVKTGAIAYWPKGIKKKGAIYTEDLHMVDIMPTILDLTNSYKRDTSISDNYVGESFSSIFKGQKFNRKSALYFQFMDNRAIRTKNFSLVEVDGSGWEIYNTKKDPLETNDLSQTLNKKTSNLDKKWLNWWKEQSNEPSYTPKSTATSIHYTPQGDKGSGLKYVPTAMPDKLKEKYSIN
ncbi:arylsulfatase [Algibacter miyuki]|uniref:Arylsulfatase n=1 Tax=Algibacter miyuki TaxID=1306933 RepID=A0ABV5H4K0_9FLAO|nr:arylsulfatase [Algibacter miyuki]MDN3664022.1 arylsulfatase [Algibacter miyuki]